MDEVLGKINPRLTNPREILDNKMTNECHRHGMIKTMFPPIDIHEETPLELKKEDDIDKHGSYLETPHQIHAHIRNFLNQLVSNIAAHEVFNPLILFVPKNFERVVVDTYVYHKYCRSCCVNLEIGTQRLMLERKPFHQLECN